MSNEKSGEIMYTSPIDNENAILKTDEIVEYDLTHFRINGSDLELEGYASVKDIRSYAEDRIRKTLLLIPEIDFAAFREEHRFDTELLQLSDDEILEMQIISIPMRNCKFVEVKNHQSSKIVDKDSLGGFKLFFDLSNVKEGKPLEKGIYKLYIKLEQLSNDNDDIKYQKIIPLSDINKFLNNGIKKTELNYYSSKKILKYNLLALFDQQAKTLRFENTLLKSYNPEEFDEEGVRKKENRYIAAIKRRLFKLSYILFNILPINKKKISFASDSRSDLTGNLYFVYEEICRQNLDVKVKFLFNERIDNKKTILQLIKTAYHFATSKIIVLDDFYPLIYPLRIRKNAELVQVWHAAGAFKTFGFSRMGRQGGPSPKSKNHRNYTKVAVSSEGVRQHYAEGFGVSIDKVIATGVPRSDIFYDEQYKKYVTNAIYERYPFLKDKKVILYAPTFRGNGQASAYFPFHVLDFKKLYEELKDEYVFLFKIHPFVNNKLTIPYEYSDFFYDFSDFREINDLLFITDILVTDYSSVCFEFALLKKPMIFFAFDVEDYIRTRDFYYDYFSFIPGPLAKTMDDMINIIKTKNFQLEKIDPFVKYFFDGNLGNASKNVVEEIIIPGLETKFEKEDKRKHELIPPKSRIELFERSFYVEDEEQN